MMINDNDYNLINDHDDGGGDDELRAGTCIRTCRQ